MQKAKIQSKNKRESTGGRRHLYLHFALSFCFLLFDILFFPSFAKATGPTEGRLQFRFRPGDKFSLVSVNEITTIRAAPVLESGGDESELSTRSEMGAADANAQPPMQTVRLECGFDVEEVDQDGNAWARFTYERIVFRVKGEGLDIEYDSEGYKPKVPPQVLPMHLAKGESFFVRITPQGRIDKVNGLSAVLGNAKSKVPNMAERNQIIRLVEQYFEESSIKRELERLLYIFPDSVEGPIDVGSFWRRSRLINNDETMLNWIWRLDRRLEADANIIAVIDVNLLISPASYDSAMSQAAKKQPRLIGDEPEVTIGSMTTRRELSGRGFGRIEVDQATGRIINSILTQDLVEEIRVLTEGPIRRPPPAPAPAPTHIVTTFQMIKR